MPVGRTISVESHVDDTAAPAGLDHFERRKLRQKERPLEVGGIAVVAAFEPTCWTRLRFRLWSERPSSPREGVQAYKVGLSHEPQQNSLQSRPTRDTPGQMHLRRSPQRSARSFDLPPPLYFAWFPSPAKSRGR